MPAQSQSQWGEPVKITSGLEIGSVQFLRNGKLLVAIKDGVAVINANGKGLKFLFRRDGIRRANMSADGNKIVFDNDLDISTANADGSAFQPVADDPILFEFAISFTPDGSNITFVTIDDAKGVYGIWIMDPDGSNKQNLLARTDLAFRHPRKSPDGSKISYFSVVREPSPGFGSWTATARTASHSPTLKRMAFRARQVGASMANSSLIRLENQLISTFG